MSTVELGMKDGNTNIWCLTLKGLTSSFRESSNKPHIPFFNQYPFLKTVGTKVVEVLRLASEQIVVMPLHEEVENELGDHHNDDHEWVDLILHMT